MTNVTSSKLDEAAYTVPGLSIDEGHEAARILQDRLHALNDLQLTLKHAHWNVVGPQFIAVHEMLDPQIELVRGWVDDLAERIATLGLSPNGLPGALVADRSWDDYSVHRAPTQAHIAALNLVYDGVIADYRTAQARLGEIDAMSEDIAVEQIRGLEQFQWFLRAHLEDASGTIAGESASSELAAAEAAQAQS
ncbi:Dps family protein [Agrococcus sp. SGAir0287]|uniref:Dps family protein n=1 Tax=Agrococcus sp. SGAir0287 TaxID=2070347 RepID=UPI0010CD5442|nr:DNA starvation/stationary phase protection protein [Agrococcus sp. SGAir0287]QCR19276.1 DNA starvation/stationary phase protection protein [Agrococcus sp. SGAir0287]